MKIFRTFHSFGKYLDNGYNPKVGDIFQVALGYEHHGCRGVKRICHDNNRNRFYVAIVEIARGRSPVGIFIEMAHKYERDSDGEMRICGIKGVYGLDYSTLRLHETYRLTRNRPVTLEGRITAEFVEKLLQDNEAAKRAKQVLPILRELYQDDIYNRGKNSPLPKNLRLGKPLNEKVRDQHIKALCKLDEDAWRQLDKFAPYADIPWNVLEDIEHLRPFH